MGNHIALREYIPDARVTTALRLRPNRSSTPLPSLADLAQALDTPARPLFIGRKPFIPSDRIFQRTQEAEDILDALIAVPFKDPDELPQRIRFSWPQGEGKPDEVGISVPMVRHIPDVRNWHTRLHGGTRQTFEGTAPKQMFHNN